MKRKYRETQELTWEFISALEAFAVEAIASHSADKSGQRLRVACVRFRKRLEERYPELKKEGA